MRAPHGFLYHPARLHRNDGASSVTLRYITDNHIRKNFITPRGGFHPHSLQSVTFVEISALSHKKYHFYIARYV